MLPEEHTDVIDWLVHSQHLKDVVSEVKDCISDYIINSK